MSNDDLGLLVLGIWVVIAVIACGIAREARGDWEFDWPMAMFWPLTMIAAGVAGVIWTLLWLGRAPVVLVRYLRRPKLPRAKVRR